MAAKELQVGCDATNALHEASLEEGCWGMYEQVLADATTLIEMLRET